MRIAYSKTFLKQAKHLTEAQRRRLRERLTLFVANPLDPILRNHPLKGAYKEYRSIDIAGDLRALYVQKGNETIFTLVGTHSQLYG